jgi:hypothetical protein
MVEVNNNNKSFDQIKLFIIIHRYTGVDLQSLALTKPIAQSHSGTLYRGKWQGNDIVARVLNVPDVTQRISRDFATEFPSMRFTIVIPVYHL